MEGENSKQFKTNANAPNDWDGAFGTLFSVVNFDSGSESRMDSEANLEGSGCSSAKISESLDTVSSPSSNSSSDELFQFNPQVLPKSRAPDEIPKPNEGTEQIYKSGKLRVPSAAWRRLEESIIDSPESISQFSDVTHESFMPHISPTQFPPSQVMERNENFDPNRIPDSIFSQPSTPTDWSGASNESLFSIHLGTESLPRDHALIMSGDINRSGELPKSGELFKSRELFLSREFYRSGELFKSGDLYKSGELKRSDELVIFRKTSSAAGEVEPNEIIDTSKNVSEDMRPGEKAVLIDEPISDVPKSCISSQSGTKLAESSHPSIANHHSAGSEIQMQSFASLIKKESACPLCHCLYSRACYCCTWPSCCCKWSGCSCKCYSWHCFSNGFSWLRCCCKCPSWPSCTCHGSNCSWLCCFCCNHKSKKSHSGSFYTWMEWG